MARHLDLLENLYNRKDPIEVEHLSGAPDAHTSIPIRGTDNTNSTRKSLQKDPQPRFSSQTLCGASVS
mgnify:CR=1 FL=1